MNDIFSGCSQLPVKVTVAVSAQMPPLQKSLVLVFQASPEGFCSFRLSNLHDIKADVKLLNTTRLSGQRES